MKCFMQQFNSVVKFISPTKTCNEEFQSCNPKTECESVRRLPVFSKSIMHMVQAFCQR